jgi:hypothetical protein
MRNGTACGIAVVLLMISAGCGPKIPPVMIQPRIDLTQHEVLGIVEFSSSAEGELGPLATREFTEAARQDQGMVRIVALGTEAEALGTVGRRQLDRTAFQALGDEHEVSTIVTGQIEVSRVRPDISVGAGFKSASVSAEISVTLSVQMVEASSGASLWNATASAKQKVGQLTYFGGQDIAFDADDPEKAYGRLVSVLVDRVTRDFQVSWEQR